MSKSDSFELARLRAAIKPYRLHWFARLRSTNDTAAERRRQGKLFAPAVVLAGRQFAGRGRNANTWWSASPGCITFTMIVPVREQVQPHHVPLIAGLAARNALAEITRDPGIELKWPNDLIYAGRKLAGLLCERGRGVDLIGIGLNANVARAEAPANLRHRITSLSEIAGRPLDKTDVLASVIRHAHRMLSRREEYPFAAVLREYDRHHVLRGRRVTVLAGPHQTKLSGMCQGLDGMGRLLVRDGGARRVVPVVAGQVQM